MVFIKAFILAFLSFALITCEVKNWTYELVSIKSTTTDPNLADIDVSEKRLGRGHYAFTGYFDFKQEMDDTTIVDVRILRSSSGDEKDYRVTPFVVENNTLSEFVNVAYRTNLMEGIKDCAPKAPQLLEEEEFEVPYPMTRINFADCDVPTDGFPNILEEGHYKIAAYMINDIEMYLEVIVKVERLW